MEAQAQKLLQQQADTVTEPKVPLGTSKLPPSPRSNDSPPKKHPADWTPSRIPRSVRLSLTKRPANLDLS